MRKQTLLIGGIGMVIGVLLSTAVVFAGNLNPGVGPTGAGSQMYTLQQIYTRLTGGGDAEKMTAFSEPSSGPTAGTMHTLDEIYALALPARVPKTGAGAIAAYTPAAGEDGLLQKGVPWPNPRFITGTTGVVTDTLTGLIWLHNANCTDTVGGIAKADQLDWTSALTYTNALATGKCGLSDGSVAGDWRMPNIREMQSLLHYGFALPAIPNTAGTGQWTTAGDPFTGFPSNLGTPIYWTSTTRTGDPGSAWFVNVYTGSSNSGGKSAGTAYVWPVRGGQ